MQKKSFTSSISKRKKLALRKVFYLLSLILLFVLLFFVWENFNFTPKGAFQIKKIQVVSSFKHIDNNDLYSKLKRYTKVGFFEFNPDALSKKLLRSPWVKSVSVRRIWPDRIAIKIKEQVAVARWNDNYLLNYDGEIFAPDIGTFPSQLPSLYGSDSDAGDVLRSYFAINKLLKKSKYDISSMKVDRHNSFSLILDDGVRIFVGHKDILPRLKMFVKMYPQIMENSNKQIDSLDLRYNDGISVRWRGAASANKILNN